jgi:hypothetical protein
MKLARVNARENLTRARDAFAEMLGPDDGKSLRYFAIHFADAPLYFASSAFLPEWDFDGKRLQDLRGLDDFYPICFSAWAKGSESAVIFCWHKSAEASAIRLSIPYANPRIAEWLIEFSEWPSSILKTSHSAPIGGKQFLVAISNTLRSE